MHDGLIDKMSNVIAFSMLPDFGQSGIYFLHRDGVIVYVGQAINVRIRIAQHLAEGRKSFDAVSFIPCEQHSLSSNERLFICWFAPSYNRCALSDQVRTLKGAGWTREQMMSLVSRDCRLNQLTVAAMIGVAIERLRLISEVDLPYTVHRETRGRVRTRRYRMVDVVAYLEHAR